MTDQPVDQHEVAVDVEEPQCEPIADPDTPADEDLDEAELLQQLDEVLGSGDKDDFSDDDEADEGAEVGRRRFSTPGGGFGGSQAPILRAVKIARRNELIVTSLKRSSGSTGSDHHTSQVRSFAADLSNGSAPTPQMDRVARRLGKLLGNPNFTGGVMNAQIGGLRFQLLYRTNVGGNHFNHVHIGCRAL
jgi:hypothetical protein